MDEFLEYITRYVPQFPEMIRGATAEEIATLESLAGLPLPPFYKEFLSRMGKNSGGISLGFQTDTNILELIEYYRTRHDKKLRPIPPDCIAIAINGYDFDVCLQHRPRSEAPVVATEGRTIYLVLAESLKKMLFQLVFQDFEVASFPCSREYSATNKQALSYAVANKRLMREAVREIAAELGFKAQWFSDAYTFCAARGECRVLIKQYDEQGMLVRVGGRLRKEVDDAGEVFSARLEIKPYP